MMLHSVECSRFWMLVETTAPVSLVIPTASRSKTAGKDELQPSAGYRRLSPWAWEPGAPR